MARSIHDVCLELVSRRSTPEEEKEEREEEEEGILSDFVFLCYLARFEEEVEGILGDFVFLCYLARFALYLPPLCLRQRLPELGQLAFPSTLLRRFLRGCVVFTAHGLVTAPASVCVGAREKTIWMNRIFARVMSGVVVLPQQAAAARCIAGKSGVIAAAESGDVADVLSYLIADANSVNKYDGYDCALVPHLYFEFATDVHVVLYFVFCTWLVIFCSSGHYTALHVAAIRGHPAVCELLIASKADVNAKDLCAFIF